MKVLIIGKGAREHALCWKAKQSPLVSEVFVAPGNAGMKAVATCISIAETAAESLADFAEQMQISLTIIGPEVSLAAGVANVFRARGLLVWGPDKAAAQIESSKDFAKDIMKSCKVATAAYQTFTESAAARAYVEKKGLPLVIKADGLAAGKGVVIPETMVEACTAIDDMLAGNRFGAAGARIVIEEFLEGEEFSLMAFVHQDKIIPMVMAQDHKRAYDNDQGPNTGGMGAYAPCFSAQSQEVRQVVTEIMRPVVTELENAGMPFTGFLYAGLILTADGFKVIEFNARFGDPEAEVILPLLESDLINILYTLLTTDKVPEISWINQYAVGVVIAAEGYPDSPASEISVPMIASSPDAQVFYGSVKEEAGALVSSGGRILVKVALASTFQTAYERVYAQDGLLKLPQTFYRRDIGLRHIRRITGVSV